MDFKITLVELVHIIKIRTMIQLLTEVDRKNFFLLVFKYQLTSTMCKKKIAITKLSPNHQLWRH